MWTFPTLRVRLLTVLIFALLRAGSAAGQTTNAPVCAGCHRDIWQKYRETGMGRSFYRPSPDKMVEEFAPGGNTYYHQPSNSYFSMIRRDGEYFQRRYQLDGQRREINVMEKRVDYIMGSGNHARTYLHRTPANTLIELPLGWYAEKGGYWAMNPGYDRPDHDGFRRPITYDCMFCHNASPRIPTGNEKPLSPAVYEGPLPEGIDCGRCHGSGDRHVKLAGTAGSKRQDVQGAIVNPGRLSKVRQTELCMSCHLETTSFPLPNAIQRYDRGPFSYRPGEPLGDFILNFDHAPGTGRDDKFEIVNAAYRLRRSACFLKSEGKMTCTTCHDPHMAPRADAAQKHYTEACRQCHSATFDKQVAAGKHTAENACANCHMPKRRTEDVVHSAATDHYIQRRKPPGDLLAERPERRETGADAYRGRVALYYPESLPQTPDNELYLAVAQVKQGSNMTEGIAQLTQAIDRHKPSRSEFYIDLAEALETTGQLAKALPYYRAAVQRSPKSAPELRKLGTALRHAGQHAEAVETLKQSASVDPAEALTWHELGLAYGALGRGTDAVAAIGNALGRDPDMPEAHNNLGILRATGGDAASAESSFREAIRIRPDYVDAHGNLANLLSGAGKFDDAREHFEIALRFRPGDAGTRYNYAMLLGRTGQYDDAQRELDASLKTDPAFADAHQLLADLLLAKGEAAGALLHYRELVRLRPNSARGHLRLGMAMASTGDKAGGIAEVREAYRGGDPTIREQATDILRQLGVQP